MIFVSVRLNGSRPLSFVLDTGSARNLIDRTLAVGLGFKTGGTGSLQGAGAGRVPISFIHGVSLALPGLESAGYEFSTADLQPLATSLGVKVDPRIRCLQPLRRDRGLPGETSDVHSAGSLRPPNGAAEELPIEMREKWAFVKAVLVLPGPVAVQDSFLIDSGSSDAVDHPIVMHLQSRASGTSGVGLGAPIQGATAHAASFRLGRYSVTGPMVSCCGATDATSKLIGNEVLRHFAVTFDYPSSRIFITPN